MSAPAPVAMRDLAHADTERMVSNIVKVWDRATDDQRARGANWYPVAHDLAAMITGGDARKGAGVIAALSAQASWARNVRDATALCAGRPVPNTRERIDKAQRILNGEDPLDVLPTGLKTGAFFACIADPEDDWHVVIDRHAHDVAVGERYGNAHRGLSYRPRYARFADTYRLAAQRLGVRPSVLQATTWLVWVES